MSVVCCRVYDDHICFASDSITVRGWTQTRNENKIHAKLAAVNGMIVGGVGNTEETVLLQLYCRTRTPADATVDEVLNFFVEFYDWKKEEGGQGAGRQRLPLGVRGASV